MNYEQGDKTSSHVATDIRMQVSPNLDHKRYINQDGLHGQLGVKPLTETLIQGLIGNIHYAHQNGYWDSAAHLRHIIDELTRGFATPANVSPSIMEG